MFDIEKIFQQIHLAPALRDAPGGYPRTFFDGQLRGLADNEKFLRVSLGSR